MSCAVTPDRVAAASPGAGAAVAFVAFLRASPRLGRTGQVAVEGRSRGLQWDIILIVYLRACVVVNKKLCSIKK